MASSRLARTLLVPLLAVVVCVSPGQALAQPTIESDAVAQYRALNVEAEKLHQNFLQANEDKDAKQAELDKATADLTAATQAGEQAKAKEQQFRGEVDDLSGATFRGARFDRLSAVLTGTSQRDFLDRSTALNVLAEGNRRTLADMSQAVNAAWVAERQATDAQHRATDARDAALKLTNEIAAQRKELDAKIATVKAELDRLTAEQKSELAGPPEAAKPTPPPVKPAPPRTPGNSPKPPPPPPPVVGAPTEAAGKAVAMALSRRGDTYSLGGSQPPVFDCSGLTSWSYAQAGVILPRTSRAQFGVGRPVPKDQLQPGDLLFYGGSAASIHHVAMYIGNGEIVHASDYGIPVKSAPMSNGGRDFFGAKRVTG